MDAIKSIITALLVAIPIFAAPRAVHCLFKCATDEEQHHAYRRRLINLMIFLVIAETAAGLLQIVLNYFT